MSRIGHARISEHNNSGWDGKAKAGDQGKEVIIANFYKKPWYRMLRCKDSAKAEAMAKACEAMCNNDCIGYDQSQRLTLHKELTKLNFDYTKLATACETDCSAFMTACAYCAGISVPFVGNNAPTTSNMVAQFEKTGLFNVYTDSTFINNCDNLKRGDVLVGKPATHTVMVLDDGKNVAQPKATQTLEEVVADVFAGKYGNGAERIKRIESETPYSYKEVQALVNKIIKG